MDEPPIRVRGGSIRMDLIHDTKQWRKHNDSKRNWKLSSGTKGSDKYLVFVGTTVGNCAKCKQGVVHVGKEIVFTHVDGTTLTVRSVQGRTRVVSSQDLDTPTVGNRTLEYPAAGGIASIIIDQVEVCAFGNANQLHSVLVVDVP